MHDASARYTPQFVSGKGRELSSDYHFFFLSKQSVLSFLPFATEKILTDVRVEPNRT